MATRTSHESIILARIRESIADLAEVSYASGMGSANRFPLAGWELVGAQQFQFGDLRIETPTTTIVVEAESGGGVTNLAKYWPYLEARPAKRFVLAHLFQVWSANDYVSHIRLWEYLVKRMRTDLDTRAGVKWGDDWEARSFRYGPSLDPIADVESYLRGAAA